MNKESKIIAPAGIFLGITGITLALVNHYGFELSSTKELISHLSPLQAGFSWAGIGTLSALSVAALGLLICALLRLYKPKSNYSVPRSERSAVINSATKLPLNVTNIIDSFLPPPLSTILENLRNIEPKLIFEMMPNGRLTRMRLNFALDFLKAFIDKKPLPNPNLQLSFNEGLTWQSKQRSREDRVYDLFFNSIEWDWRLTTTLTKTLELSRKTTK